jgi:hypothetical protein
MRRLVQMFRSRYDYSVFQVRDEWPFLLSVAGVILGAVTVLPSSVGIVLGVIAFVLGLGVFVRDVRELRRRWRDYEFNRFAAPFPTADIRPPSAYPDPVYLFVPGERRGTALVSAAIDHAVATQDMAVRLDEEPYHLPKSLRVNAHYVLPKVNAGREVFNGKIIGMRGDPLPRGSVDRPAIRLHVAQFFDAQCSNEMCAFTITHRNGDPGFDPRRELLRNANGELRTLAESDLSDCIGISTVAFTADNALILTKQTDRNIASADLLAPSGSGSLDPRDLGPREEILQDVVRRGMERELCEETGIRPSEIHRTEVIGFARWLDRGAKPEFLGITKLSINAKDIEAGRRLSWAERTYTAGTKTRKLDLAELGRELASGVDLLSAASLPEEVRDFGSLPLLLALRAAALRLASVTSVSQEPSVGEPGHR